MPGAKQTPRLPVCIASRRANLHGLTERLQTEPRTDAPKLERIRLQYAYVVGQGSLM